jgi:excisionase family DNA binding protein
MSATTSTSTLPLPAQDVLTLAEAAGYLRISEEALRKLAAEDAIPARKIGDEWRFWKHALEDWLAQCPPRKERYLPAPPLWYFEYPPVELMLAELERRLLDKLASRQAPAAKTNSKERLLALAGAWKDDPTVDEMLKTIAKQRGRPMTGEDE